MDNAVPDKHVKKRDGSIVGFDRRKISHAIERAAFEVLQDKDKANDIATDVTDLVIKALEADGQGGMPDIESIQDHVESALMHRGYSQIAKAYILYRENRTQIRTTKSLLGFRDDLKLPINSIAVLRRRYLLRDDDRNIIETPGALFRRVATHVAQAEKNFKSAYSLEQTEGKFYRMMRDLEFMPNSPTLMNSGTTLGQLSACFVLPVEDSIDGIFDTLHHMAKIHQTGGGTGFSFSRLRPKNDFVSTTKGEASGPVSFMSIFDRATSVIVQGGRRRGANMGILRCDHPDITEFIEAKKDKRSFSNFNLSVGVTELFMEAVRKNEKFSLISPRTNKSTGTIKASALFDLIVNAAWETGDPGLVFLDEINRANPTPEIGLIEATNPCGELPLLPYESCNLASVNLAKMVRGSSVDWQKLRDRIRWGIRFLDNVIEVNTFPLSQIKEITCGNRKTGLGVMGFADMLIKLRIPYVSKEAVGFAQKLMRFIRKESVNASVDLAEERGVFPNWERSVYSKKNLRLRNATVNTIAPTGTISIIAGCSSGIEPLFAVSFVRNVLAGTRLFEVNPLFEEIAKEKGIYSKDLLAEIAHSGSVQNIRGISDKIKKLFVTTFDTAPEQHLRIQAAFQKYTDNSVSKTVNLPSDATIEDVKKTFFLASSLRCKGITVYRYGSRTQQVLTIDKQVRETEPEMDWVTAETEYSGGCAGGICQF